MAWRVLILVLSAAAHYWWLVDPEAESRPQLSGGSQALPVSVSLSMVTLKAQPETVKPKVETAPDQSRQKHQAPEVVTRKAPSKRLLIPEKVVPQEKKETSEPKTEEVEAPSVMVKASSQQHKPQVMGLESLPIVKEAGFRSQPEPPTYPKLSLRKRQQGEALVQALVDEKGQTRRVKLVRSSGHRLLDKSALTAVQGWQFRAARIDDAPVMAWVEVPVAFEIN